MIQIFNNNQFGNIRALEIETTPYFVGRDVAIALGYAKPENALRQHVDNEDTLKQGIPDKQGLTQTTVLINESGVYSLVFGSKLPTAKDFKRWVTKDILPAIRKHGGYLTPQKIEEALLNPDTIIQLATTLKAEQAKRIEAEAKNKELQPKALFADAVSTSNRSCLISELAKILKQNGVEIGQNRLFEWMRKHGYLCSKGEYYNQPTQRAMDLEVFEIKKTTINKPDGSILVSTTTKVTGKGQIYFVNKFLSTKNDAN